jgi:hypothetical protein
VSTKSGLLLGFACVAAIAAVGSVFELSSGQPSLGNWTTAVILALSVPLGVSAFVIAARDARANQ